MDDDRVTEFERSLWIGGDDVYRRCVSEDCLMVLPRPPFVMSGTEAIAAVSDTPRWSDVDFSDFRINRPEEDLIVIAYHAQASRGPETFQAYCTSTYQRLGHEDWRVVQHQQTVPLTH